MRIKSSVGLAVGPANETRWGQVLVTPNAYGIIEMYDPQGRAQTLGVQALSYLGQHASEGISSLEGAIGVVERIATVGMETIVLFVPVGRIVYIVIRGHGGVYVKRGKELASLMTHDGEISGQVHEGDVFLLASKGFSGILTHEELSRLFDHLSATEVAEKMTILLHEKTNGEGSVAMVYGADAFTEEFETDNTGNNSSATQSPDTEQNDVTPTHTTAVVSRGTPKHSLRVTVIRAALRFRSYVHTLLRQPKKITKIIVICLIFLFIISVMLGVVKQQSSKQNAQVVSAITDSQHALDEGVALIELNPIKGRERLTYAKGLLEPLIKTVSSRTTEGRKIALLYKQISDSLTEALHIVDVSPEVFYDASLLKKDAVVSGFALYEKILAGFDRKTGTVFDISADTKNAQIIGGGTDATAIQSIGIHGDNVYALTPDGIVKYTIGEKKSSVIIKKDAQWVAPSSIVVFGGNIYLLDVAKSRIWKYVATDMGFSELREYLNPDTLTDLSKTTSISIDGSVWLGTTTGTIIKFTQGKEQTFTPKGVEPPLGTNLSVYTSDTAANLYVYDAQQSRMVVLDKEGMYISQYRFTSAGSPTSFIVSEELKKALFLVDGKIYALALK